MDINKLIYLAKYDIRTLSTGGARYKSTELEHRIRQARKTLNKLNIEY